MRNAGLDYVDAPEVVAEFVKNFRVPRTDAPLASLQGDITFFTKRIDYETKLVESLPAILIDLNSLRPTRYDLQGGSSRRRGIQLAVVIFTPVYAYLDGTAADEIATYLTTADTDIKSLYGDVESMLNTLTGRSLFHELELIDSPGIEHDTVLFSEETKIRARVAELWCTAWRRVAGM